MDKQKWRVKQKKELHVVYAYRSKKQTKRDDKPQKKT